MNAKRTVTLHQYQPQHQQPEEGQDDFDLLNQDQQQAVQQIFQFLFSNEKEFMVSGPAGTGKTHLMKFVMRHTLDNYEGACALLGTGNPP